MKPRGRLNIPQPATSTRAERARATRAQLQTELAAARAAGDRERVSQLLGRLMFAAPDRNDA